MPVAYEILTDTISRSVIKMAYDGTSAITGGLATTITTNTLTKWKGASGESSQVDVGKIFWTMPTDEVISLAWGYSGNAAGATFMYLSGNGYVNFNQDGMSLKNTLTGSTRTNSIIVNNATAFETGDAFTLILELDKVSGYGITNDTNSVFY